MNKPTSLFTAPPFSPLIQKNRRCSCKRHIAVLQSLIKCNDRVIEKIYSSITLQCWLHEACGFWKKKWLHRERKREIKRERERERILPLSYTESVLPDVLSRSSEMVEKAAVEEEGMGGGGVGKQRCAHTSTTIFLCISRPPTTWKQTEIRYWSSAVTGRKELLLKINTINDGWIQFSPLSFMVLVLDVLFSYRTLKILITGKTTGVTNHIKRCSVPLCVLLSHDREAELTVAAPRNS